MLHFVSSLIVQFDVDSGVHQIAVITFGDKSVVEFGLETYNNTHDIIENVRNLTHRSDCWVIAKIERLGMTNTSGALWMLREKVFNADRRRLREAAPIAIILTDGRSTMEANSTFTEAALTKQAGVSMFAIGISDEALVTELEAMASHPLAKHMFRVEDFRTLSKITNNILEYTCDIMPRYMPGDTGSAGPTGSSGALGAPGATGSAGGTGIAGPPGHQGDEGAPGEIGSPGNETGAAGPEGPAGAGGVPGSLGGTGATGPRGIPGDSGDIGESRDSTQASEGVPGEAGAPGTYGEPGISGVSGATGGTGQIGYRGSPGSTGYTGPPGPRGDRGHTGIPGRLGPKGHVGPIGFIYEDGNDCGMNKSLCEQICVNKRVGYECVCYEGYDLGEDGFSCTDRNECAVKNGGCEQFCHNLLGSFACSCTLGFTLSLDSKTCVDVDECCGSSWPYACPETHACLNTLGSFFCLHSALISDLPSMPTPVPQVASSRRPLPQVASTRPARRTSVFLQRTMMIGVLIWLCALTVLVLIAVIVACSLSDTLPYIQALGLQAERGPEQYQPSDRQVFPRLSLHPRAAMDPGIRNQDEINMDLTALRRGGSAVSVNQPPRPASLYPSMERL